MSDPDTKQTTNSEYWDMEAEWWALEAHRIGSSYRKSLRPSWWLWLVWTFGPLPKKGSTK